MESLSLYLNAPEPIYPQPRRRSSLLTIIWRRRRIGFTIFVVMMLATGLCIFVMPRPYEASMQFMVSNDRVKSPIGSDNNTQAVVYMNDINEAQVNTEVSILTSNDLLLDLVRKAGLVSGGDSSPEQNEQVALKKLKAHLVVTPVRRSSVIDVRYRSSNRDSAIHVLDVLSTIYLDAHARLHGTSGAVAAFESLWESASAERAKAEAALLAFKREHNIVSLPDERAIALQREADLEKQYADASVAAGKSSRQTQVLEQILDRTPSSIVGERKSIPHQGEVEHLGSVLAGLQLKRIEAVSRYAPTDRMITDLDQQIAETKTALAAASTQRAEEVSMVSNPVLREAQSDMVRVRGDYAGNQEQADQLRRKLAMNRKQLVALDEAAAAYSLLNEKVTRFTDLDHIYRQKADTAHTDESLTRNHISNVNLAETPFAPPDRSPLVRTIVGVGMIWSFVSSLFAMLIVDRLRARVTSPFEIEGALGAPVIAVLSANTSSQHPFGYVPAVYGHIVRQSPKSAWRLA